MSKQKLTATPILAVVALTFLPAAQGGGCSIGDIEDQAQDALDELGDDGEDGDDACPEGTEEVEICEGDGPMGEGPQAGPQTMGPPPGGEGELEGGGEGCELVCVPEDELDDFDDDGPDDDLDDGPDDGPDDDEDGPGGQGGPPPQR